MERNSYKGIYRLDIGFYIFLKFMLEFKPGFLLPIRGEGCIAFWKIQKEEANLLDHI